jgi:3-oxoacyl-[acyl-carrier-protein] synthase III
MTSLRSRAVIRATGMSVPDKIVTNADFERIVDTSDEWITTRTGIKERRMCASGENTADMAAEAARRTLDEAELRPENVDVLILSTATPDHLLPATACETQALLGCDNAAAFDISAACAGWLYGISLADALITSGMHENVLVIGSEKMSAILDYTDRTTCVLFGDGAGAALVTPGEGNGRGILATHMRTNGRQARLLWRPAGGAALPSTDETRSDRMEFVKQEGREIFKQAVVSMDESCRCVLETADLNISEVDLVIPHQANIRIIEAVAKRLGVEDGRVFINIDRYGNTSSASIPIALDEARRQGRVGEGSMILMTAFGGGLSWGASLVVL